MDVGRMGNPRDEQVADFMASFELLDLLRHFRKRLWFQHMQIWFHFQQDKLLHSHSDYILGSDSHMFYAMDIWYLINFSSDHFALSAQLLRWPIWCHIRYLRGQRAFPLRLLQMSMQRLVYAKSQELKAQETHPPPSVRAPRPQWMTSETIRLIYTCATLHV